MVLHIFTISCSEWMPRDTFFQKGHFVPIILYANGPLLFHESTTKHKINIDAETTFACRQYGGYIKMTYYSQEADGS